MKSEEYKIINTGDGIHSLYGEVFIVRANPVTQSQMGRCFQPYFCPATESFIFVKDESIMNIITQIARGGGYWTPDQSEFEDEMIRNERFNRMEIIHIHDSLTIGGSNFSINSGKQICLIPDAQYKARKLNEQFYSGDWYYSYSFRQYVESLAEGDDVQGFWSWLFRVKGYDGLKPWQLPRNYYEEYERFLDICSTMDV